MILILLFQWPAVPAVLSCYAVNQIWAYTQSQQYHLTFRQDGAVYKFSWKCMMYRPKYHCLMTCSSHIYDANFLVEFGCSSLIHCGHSMCESLGLIPNMVKSKFKKPLITTLKVLKYFPYHSSAFIIKLILVLNY